MDADALAARPSRADEAPPARGAALAGVFAATFVPFLAVGAVLPVLPRYVQGPLESGDVAVGVVIGCFAFSAVVGRPWAGRAADRRGRRAIVVLGASLTAVAGLLYLVPAGIAGLVVARLVLGAGDGMLFTAGATWTVDLAPEERRGQAIGLFGLSVWGALALGPLLGEGLYAAGGYDAVWVFAAAAPAAGALVARRLPDPHPVATTGERPRLLPVAARRPGVALALANVGYATLSGFVVLHLAERGIGHGAATFTAFAAAVVSLRLLAGRLPDRLGARRMALAAFAVEAVGLAVVGAATAWWTAVGGAILTGAGFSVLFPSLALMVVDRTPDRERGTAMGAFTAFFDVGVGLGAPLAGAVSALAGYPVAFWTAAGCALAGAAVATSRSPDP